MTISGKFALEGTLGYRLDGIEDRGPFPMAQATLQPISDVRTLDVEWQWS